MIKVFIYYFAILVVLFQAGCCKCDMTNLENRIQNLENRHISSETAIAIAEHEMKLDMKRFDVSVKEGIDFWEVHFSTKCTDCVDGHPYIVINKLNGDVVRVYPYGETLPQ
jgi:hypothetical protein